MKKISLVVAIVTTYIFVMETMPYIGMADEIIFGLFSILPFLIIYMVFVILKYGKPSPHTFDERFYDDFDYKRNFINDSRNSND